MRTISIQVPPGAREGDSLMLTVDGQNLEISLPTGSTPGDCLELHLGEADEEDGGGVRDNANPANNCTTKVSLRNGEEITIEDKLPKEEVWAPSQSSRFDGTHSQLWPAARRLSEFIDAPSFVELMEEVKSTDGPRSFSCLELGSGLGLVGLVLSCVLSRHLLPVPVQVVLSDVPDAMEILHHNIRNNSRLVRGGVAIATTPLVWHASPWPKTNCRFDLVVGSDLLYNTKNIPALACTILRLCNASTTILLAVRWRKPHLERSFFMLLSERIQWRLIDGWCQLSWDEYGNASCEASNRYFIDTSVAVSGKPVSLAEIEESDLKMMTTAEYDAWENFQTQIYLGEVKDKKKKSTMNSIPPKKRSKR